MAWSLIIVLVSLKMNVNWDKNCKSVVCCDGRRILYFVYGGFPL